MSYKSTEVMEELLELILSNDKNVEGILERMEARVEDAEAASRVGMYMSLASALLVALIAAGSMLWL